MVAMETERYFVHFNSINHASAIETIIDRLKVYAANISVLFSGGSLIWS